MRQQKKLAKFLALITGVFLAVMLLPSNTAAAGAKTTLDVSYGSAYIGTGYLDAYSPSGVKVTTPNANGYIITGEAVLKYDKSYQVSVISGTHNIVLDNLKIHNHYDIQSTAFYVAQGATAHITLIGENRLIAPGAGMLVPENATVSITGGAADSLYAQGTHIGAGIGGREATFTSYAFANSGTISIKGGVITAVGTSLAAGIGGGEYGYGGVISISGGTIRATGGGAGIGGGYGGRESIVTKLSVTGGSINTSSMGVTPVNAANQLVYLTTITVPGAVSAQVSALTVRQGSSVVPYSITGMKTDANSKLYLYIPASASRTTADVTVNGVTYPFSGLVSANNANVLKLDQAPFSVSMNSTYTYGDLLSPLTAGGSVSSEPVLTYSGTDGITGAVFANSPQKPVNIGSYTVTAVLPGNETYNDATASSSFSIVKKSISPFFVAAIPDQTYTGSVIAPAVTVIDPDRSITLTANTDYTVSGGAVLVGHAAVTISGSGNYEGSLTRPFTIIPKAISIALSAAPPATTKVGNDITLTAEFLGTVDIPAGTVTFSANGIAFAAGMAFRDASGRYVAIATWNDVPAGSYSLTAHYLAAPADNYLCTAPGQIASYTVTRYDQPDFRFVTGADYSISGGVISKTYGDAPFTLQTAGKLSAGVITYASSNPAVASVDSTGLVTLHKDGTVTLSATSPSDDRYLAATATVTLEIAKAAQPDFQLVNSDPISKTYGDAPFLLQTTGKLSEGAVTYTSSSPAVASVDNTGLVTLHKAGTVTLSATSPADDRYLAATATVTLEVAKAAQTGFQLVNSDPISKTYGDAPFTLQTTGKLSAGVITYASSDPAVASVDSTGQVTLHKAGTITLSATSPSDDRCLAATATVTLEVVKAAQPDFQLVNSDPISKTYGDAPFLLQTTGKLSEGAVTYTSSDPAVASVDSTGLVTLHKSGTVILSVLSPADDRYLAATATVTLEVAKAAQIGFQLVNSEPVSKTYGDVPFTLQTAGKLSVGVITYASSGPAVASVDSAGLVTLHKAGTVAISATSPADDRYLAATATVTLEVTKAAQTGFQLVNSDPVSKTYGDAPFLLETTGKQSEGDLTYLSSDPAVASVDSTGLVTLHKSGTVTLSATSPADDRYLAATATVTLEVAKAAQPDFQLVNSDPISKTYGDAPFLLETTGKLSEGAVTYTSNDPAVASVDSTGLVTLHKSGTVTLSVVSPADDRYLAATATVTLEVAKAAQVGFSFTVSSIDKIYGDAPFTVPLTGLLSSGHVSYAVISGSDVVAIDASSGQITLITSGMATISATSPSDDRYLEATAQLTLSIAKAQQPDFAFNVSSVSKTYGDAPFAVPVAGALSSGDLSFAVTSGDAVGVDAVSGEVTIIKSGSAVVTATQAGDNNYEAAVATVAITVEKATPVPIVFPTSGSITYGMALSSSPLSGGSGDGSFAWLHPETIPSVSNSGYTVVFIPRDTENYDYTGISLEAILPLAVSKAVPDVVFPTASALVYGDSLTRSVLTGGSGDGSFAWLDPEAIPAVVNDGFPVRFTPRDGDNFLPVEQVVRVRVTKAAQQPLSLDGVPDAICYADEPFALDVSGGSGTGELRFAVSSGDAVAIDAISGEVTILKAGDAVVTVIKAGDSNYEATSAVVVVTVEKAAPVPVIFPAAGSITYGETLSSSLLSGGSGDGIFAWRYPETEPAVTNSGYTAVFIPRDTENYDYTGISLEATLPLTVNKAVPEVVFPTASALVYGDSLARSVLTGGSGDGSFAWLDPDEIPTVVNDGFLVRFTPRDGDNVLSVEQVVRIRVAKAAQQPLVLSGIPDVVRQTDEPFVLDVSGGSGTGALRFAVSSGDAVAVDSASGEVTILKAGDATVTVSKAGDSNHEAVSASVRILVESAAAQDPEPSPTGIPTGTPSATPAPTLTPALPARVTPAATVTPEPPDAEPMQIPAVISEDTETGRFMVTVKIADLPAGTTSVQLANGTLVDVNPNAETIQLEVGQDDLADGILELRALNAQKPLRSMRIAVAEDFERSPAGGPGTFTVILWLAAGLALAGLAGLGLVAGKKARRSPKQ